MATYALIHGGGGGAWDWHLVEPELRALGHDVVAVDLPMHVESATLEDFADVVLGAVGGRDELVAVGHSFGGFTAPVVAARRPARALVFVTGMVPRPGEPPGEWWPNTGHAAARRAIGAPPDEDPVSMYMQDVEPELAAAAMAREQSEPEVDEGDPARAPGTGYFEAPFPLAALPAVPTHFVLCARDRYFPPDWMRGVVRDRLGVVPDVLDAGHMPMLSRPRELAGLLHSYQL